MNVQNEEKVEDSLELLMRGGDGEIIEDSFDKITMKKKFHQKYRGILI